MKTIYLILLFFGLSFSQNNYSLTFDGGDYLTKAVNEFRSSDTQGSISLWVKFSSLAANQWFWDVSSGSNDDRWLAVGVRTSGKIAIGWQDGGTITRMEGGSVTTGVWYNVLASSDGSNYFLAINGVNQSLTTASGTNNGNWLSDISATTDLVGFGALVRSTIAAQASCVLDEIAYFSTNQHANAAAIYNAGVPYDLSTTATTFNRLEEGTGTTTADELSVLNFTAFGNGSTSSTYPTWTAATLGWDSGDDGQDEGFKEHSKRTIRKTRKIR